MEVRTYRFRGLLCLAGLVTYLVMKEVFAPQITADQALVPAVEAKSEPAAGPNLSLFQSPP